jgi:molybdopterin-guanine dinucleotide biosynthesis protein A
MLDAVVIAGAKNSGPLSECSDEAYEAMIRIGAKPMVRYVVEALLGSGYIKKVIVIGPAELKQEFPEESVQVVQGNNSIVGNALAAINYVDKTNQALLVTCDVPMLTAEAVKDFVDSCQDKKVDFFYSIVSMEEIHKRFPGHIRTTVKLIEGAFTGGNLFVLDPVNVAKQAEHFRQFVNNRKSPFNLCRILGIKFVLKLIFNRLTVLELEVKISEVLGIKVKAVTTSFPEIGVDVDKLSDYLIASEYLNRSE